MRALCRALVASGCVSAWFSCAHAIEFHVSPAGNDTNPGTAVAPFATLTKARDQVRQVPRESGELREAVTVWIHAGTYVLDESLHFTAEDSGSATAPVVWSAAPGEVVRVVGGKVIEQFVPLSDATIRNRLSAEAQSAVVMIDLAAQGIDDFGNMTERGRDLPAAPAPLELFHVRHPLRLARWPNTGWTRSGPVTVDGAAWQWTNPTPRNWQSPADAWVHAFFENDWSDRYTRLARVDWSTGAAFIDATTPHEMADRSAKTAQAGRRFQVLNVLEELDAPGEWYLDRDQARIYAWLPTGTQPGDLCISLLETPLSLYGVSFFTLQGMTIEAARVCAIEVAGGEQVHIHQCTVRHTGNVGVNVHHGLAHRISHCEIYETGDGAVRLEGGDLETLEPCQHTVEHNHIHHFNRWVYAHRPAVLIYGVGHQVKQNLIHDGPDSAVIVQGNDNLIEGNEIHSVCRETNDVGAFAMSHDWTQRGNVVRHNYFHDLGSPEFDATVAVYLDDFASGTLVEGNVFQRAGRGVLIGGGRDNRVVNNVFVEMVAGVQVDARGKTWGSDLILDSDSHLWTRWREAMADGSPYREKYPELVDLEQREPELPLGNQIERNLFRCEVTVDLHDGLNVQTVPMVGNWLQGDPGLVEEQPGRLQLADDSPARELGILPIAWDRIGPQASPTTADAVAQQ